MEAMTSPDKVTIMKVFQRIALLLMAVWMGVGCSHPISGGFRVKVDPELTAERLIHTPENFVGQKVMLGGLIVETRNFDGYSVIEAVQVDLDCFGYLKGEKDTHGRVIFRQSEYVESMIFKQGREVTVGGTVRGVQQGKVGESPYTFLVIDVEEIQLWESLDANYYGYPYYWNGTWGPFYGPPYRYRPGFYYW